VSVPVHPAAMPIDELLSECDIVRTRRSGPGGQHRNKVETAVVITHRPTGCQGQASERRSQDLNRQAATQRLRVKLAVQIRTPISLENSPSSLWHSRVRGRQLAVNSDHADFPALLAEALDRLHVCDWEAPAAATQLGVSTSQLVKFLAQQPEALMQLNAARQARGQRPLR
jgi:hypothetical protein